MKKLSTLIAAIAVMSFASVAQAQPPTFDDLGVIGGAGAYSFDTLGSTMTSAGGTAMDTELGLWDSAGNLLAENDDNGGGGLWSLINISLADGEYYLGASEFATTFGPNFDMTGSQFESGEFGDILLNVNGSTLGSQVAGNADTGNDPNVFWKVTVSTIPEPSSLALLGVAGLGLVVRRRRK